VSGLITNILSPDDSLWRISITSITVNGIVLTNTAYARMSLARSCLTRLNRHSCKALVQNIVISAAGYSTIQSFKPRLRSGDATGRHDAGERPLGNGGTLTISRGEG